MSEIEQAVESGEDGQITLLIKENGNLKNKLKSYEDTKKNRNFEFELQDEIVELQAQIESLMVYKDIVTKLPSLTISINGLSNEIHNIPLTLFNDVRDGKVDITCIDDYPDIIPAILKEWQSMILRGCND